MAWQDFAQQAMGGQAPSVIQYLSQIDPNYDWTPWIGQAAQQSQQMYGDSGWMDPTRGSSAELAKTVVGLAQQLGDFSNKDRGLINSLDATGHQQEAQIQQVQGSHGGGGMGGMLGLAALAAGAYFGIPALGEALGAGAGLSEGAAWGAGLGAGSSDLAAMQGAVGLGGGAMDLGGGLTVDEFGNVTNGLFQGGPGTAGAGDFFSGGASGLDFGGGMNLSNASQIAQIARALGIGGGGGSGLVPQQGGGQGGGFNLGQLLPLLGIGSGLNTMLNRTNAVDPARVNAMWQAGQNTYNTSLDPQNQLHDFLQQQTVDNSRAATSARGIGMAGNAAGIENDATRNFNMDWQNQQLARQAQGTQSLAQAGQGAAQAGIANNAQAFTQNQTGLNNLTTGLGQVFGNNGLFGPGSGTNGVGSWLTSMFGGGGSPAATPPTSYDTSMIGQGVG